MAEAPKRVHDSPTGQTPGKKPPKRRSETSGRFIKKSLFQSDAELEKNVEKGQKVYINILYVILLLDYFRLSEHMRCVN